MIHKNKHSLSAFWVLPECLLYALWVILKSSWRIWARKMTIECSRQTCARQTHRRTDKVTHWAPIGAKGHQKCVFTAYLSHSCSNEFILFRIFGHNILVKATCEDDTSSVCNPTSRPRSAFLKMGGLDGDKFVSSKTHQPLHCTLFIDCLTLVPNTKTKTQRSGGETNIFQLRTTYWVMGYVLCPQIKSINFLVLLHLKWVKKA